MAEAGNQKIYAGKGLLCKLFSDFFVLYYAFPSAVLRLSPVVVSFEPGLWHRLVFPSFRHCSPVLSSS